MSNKVKAYILAGALVGLIVGAAVVGVEVAQSLLGLVILLGIPALLVYAGVRYYKRQEARVQCINCQIVVSRRRWGENKGCIQCGGDLYNEV